MTALLAVPAGGLVVELEDTHNIVIREPRLNAWPEADEDDIVRITVTNIDGLIDGLKLCREYRDAREQTP